MGVSATMHGISNKILLVGTLSDQVSQQYSALYPAGLLSREQDRCCFHLSGRLFQIVHLVSSGFTGWRTGGCMPSMTCLSLGTVCTAVKCLDYCATAWQEQAKHSAVKPWCPCVHMQLPWYHMRPGVAEI